MRGGDHRSEGLFSYVSCEARVPGDHPLRAIRAIADEALEVLSGDLQGWRWTRIWGVTVFTKNRERLLAGDIAAKFLSAVVGQPRLRALLSDDHFSVGGTLIEAPACLKWGQREELQAQGGRWRFRRGARIQG